MDRKEETCRFHEELFEVRKRLRAMRSEIGTVVRGQEQMIDFLQLALHVGGHVKLHGIPGVGKTLAFDAFGHVAGLNFVKKQFVPDMYPADLIGRIDRSGLEYVFRPGRIRPRTVERPTNIFLADEVNRAPSGVFAAVLQAMQEFEMEVDEDGTTVPLSPVFMVCATMNPFDEAENYEVPVAAIWRFLFNIEMHNPSEKEVYTLARSARFGETDAERIERLKILSSLDDVLRVRDLMREWKLFCFDDYEAQLQEYTVERYLTKILTWFEEEHAQQFEAFGNRRDLEESVSARSVLRLVNAAWFRALQEPDVDFMFYPLAKHVRDILIPGLAHCIRIAPHVPNPEEKAIELLKECVHDLGANAPYWTPCPEEKLWL